MPLASVLAETTVTATQVLVILAIIALLVFIVGGVGRWRG